MFDMDAKAPPSRPLPVDAAESSRDGDRRAKKRAREEGGELSRPRGRPHGSKGRGKDARDRRFPDAAWYFSQTFWSRTSLRARYHTQTLGDGITRRCAQCERGTCSRCTFRSYKRVGKRGGEPITVRFCKFIQDCTDRNCGATKRDFFNAHCGGLRHNGRNVTDFTNMLDARVIEFGHHEAYTGLTYKLGPNFAAWQRGELWPDVGLSRNMILALPKDAKRRNGDVAFVEGWAALGGDVTHEVFPFQVRRELFRAYWVMFRMQQTAGTVLPPDVRRRIALLAAGAKYPPQGLAPDVSDNAGRRTLLERERQRRQALLTDPWQIVSANTAAK